MNNFTIVKFFLVFLIPFCIIIVSSTKLLIFLDKWSKENLKTASFTTTSSTTIRTHSIKKDTEVVEMNDIKIKTGESVEKDEENFKSETLLKNRLRNQGTRSTNLRRYQLKKKEIKKKSTRIVLSIVALFFLQW